MTDYLNRFGAISATTPFASANTLDFAPIDAKAAMQSHRTGEQHDSTVVFYAAADVTGSVTPKLQHADTSEGTYTDLVVGEAVTNPKAGNFALIPMPKKHKRFVRAATAATVTGVEAFLEPGPSQPR